jgi:hypothetical protein
MIYEYARNQCLVKAKLILRKAAAAAQNAVEQREDRHRSSRALLVQR